MLLNVVYLMNGLSTVFLFAQGRNQQKVKFGISGCFHVGYTVVKTGMRVIWCYCFYHVSGGEADLNNCSVGMMISKANPIPSCLSF